MTKKNPSIFRFLRWFFYLLIVLLMAPILFLGGSAMFWKPKMPKHLVRSKLPLNIGHRGGGGLAPENTMLAFQAAHRAGADGVEFDVMFSKDKKLIVFHDNNLQDRLPVPGKVSEMTFEELKKINLSPYYQLKHPEQNIPDAFLEARAPSLKEVFDFYKEHPKTILNVEIKYKKIKDSGLEKAIAKMIQDYKYQNRVIVSSFNPFSIQRFRRYASKVPTGLIYSRTNAIYLRNLWFLGLAKPDALHPNFMLVDKKYMDWAKKRGFMINVWTVNEPEEMRRLIDLGVHSIITDYPDVLAKVLAEKQGLSPKKNQAEIRPTTTKVKLRP